MLIDPIISIILFPWRKTNCLKSFARQHVLEEANLRFKQEMDLTKILRKIRDSHDMLKYMVCSEDKSLLKV